ncbi:MAG: phosphodiesterase [Alphaproteobacteria bacterium]|nr:phosphodiesterase [Alphaproteobacteria bacterium]
MLIAQISDLHIQRDGKPAYGVVDTVTMLKKAVETLNALDPQPDVVLATGDLVERGSAEEYAILTEILKPLKAPLLVVPGNHDARGPLAKAFPEIGKRVGDSEFFHYAVDEFPVRLIGYDTTVPKHHHGEVCAARAEWLDRTLAAGGDKPTMIFLHHPPFRTRIAVMDKSGLANSDRMAAVVAKYPNVERILCGHIHRSIQARFAGTIASVAPSTAHQIAMDIRDDAPLCFNMDPPGFQLHAWAPDNGIVSYTAAIGDYGEPIKFPW